MTDRLSALCRVLNRIQLINDQLLNPTMITATIIYFVRKYLREQKEKKRKAQVVIA